MAGGGSVGTGSGPVLAPPRRARVAEPLRSVNGTTVADAHPAGPPNRAGWHRIAMRPSWGSVATLPDAAGARRSMPVAWPIPGAR